MFSNLTIRTKLIIILLTLGLIPSLVLGFISLSVSHTALSEQAFNHLISTRDAKKAQIERYFQDIRADISVLANSSHIVAALDGFSSVMEGLMRLNTIISKAWNTETHSRSLARNTGITT
jgi:hypothetical protein